jgi:hypothetical protein
VNSKCGISKTWNCIWVLMKQLRVSSCFFPRFLDLILAPTIILGLIIC